MERRPILVGLIAFFIGLAACHGRAPALFKETSGPKVIIAEGSDPVPKWLVPHIVKRTDKFCKESGRPGVEEIAIKHYAKKRHTDVVYICLTDPKTVQEIRESTVPFRVVDEEIGKAVVSYYSSKAVVCIYIKPHCVE
jgi:hypothetical protein